LDLLKSLKDAEGDCGDLQEEIELLKSYIIDLKSRIAVYIPVKGDPVDKKVAEYINNYPDRQAPRRSSSRSRRIRSRVS